jgi:hypothetical protein
LLQVESTTQLRYSHLQPDFENSAVTIYRYNTKINSEMQIQAPLPSI